MTRWLSIVGLGLSGRDGLTSQALAALDSAEIVFGSPRQLDLAEIPESRRRTWPSVFSEGLEQVANERGRQVAVLATGDPMHFGAGASLMRHVGADEVTVYPQPSAFSLAAARLGWPLRDCACLSAHGRPLSAILPYVQPGARMLILSENTVTPVRIAAMLDARGFGPSRVTVLERLGGSDERIVEFAADETLDAHFDAFAVIAVDCALKPGADLLPAIPGLPDEAFIHDGQLTKREVRAVTLAALAPYPGALLWDIGAGCGSVAIEWLRACPQARAVAFEKSTGRLQRIAENADRLGTPALDVVAGDLPGTLEGRAAPDAIFHGGAISSEKVFEAAWTALRPGGRFVSNAVTLEGEAALVDRHGWLGGELVRIEVSHAEKIGPWRGMRPKMAVMQWRAEKPA